MQIRNVEKQRFGDQARKLLAARYAIIFVQTHEEGRLERVLADLASKAFSQPIPFFRWSVTEGLSSTAETIPDTQDPDRALQAIIAHPRAALFMVRDLHRFYDDPKVVRRLRDVYRALRSNYKTVFLCGPELDIPPELEKEVTTLDLPPPDLAEMEALFEEVKGGYKGLTIDLGERKDARSIAPRSA
jgi:hypothetical protein